MFGDISLQRVNWSGSCRRSKNKIAANDRAAERMIKMSAIASLNKQNERKRFLTQAEAENLLGRNLSLIEKAQQFTIEDLEEMLSKSYECQVCLQP